MYGTATNIFYDTGEGTLHVITDVGVSQGDSLGSFLFSGSLSKSLRHARCTPPKGCLHVRFSDDGAIVGPPDVVFPYLSEVAAAGATIGLILQPSKCTLYIPSTVPPPVVKLATDQLKKPEFRGFKQAEGLILCGVAVGERRFIENHLRTTLASFTNVLQLVKNFALNARTPGSLQHSFILLRYTVVPALLTYLARTHPTSIALPILNEADRAVETAIREMIGAGNEPVSDSVIGRAYFHHANRIIHANLNIGGLGFTSFAQLMAPGVIGSASLAIPLWLMMMKKCCPNGYVSAPLPVTFSDANSLISVGIGTKAGIKVIEDLAVANKPLLKVQSRILSSMQKGFFDDMYNKAPDARAKALLLSNAGTGATAYLTSINTSRDWRLYMDNTIFSLAVRQHTAGFRTIDLFSGKLPVNPRPDGEVIRCIDCNPIGSDLRPNIALTREIGDLGFHAESCQCGQLKAIRIKRHTAIGKTLRAVVFQAYNRLADGTFVDTDWEPDITKVGGVRLKQRGAHMPISRADYLVQSGAGSVLVDTHVCSPIPAFELSVPSSAHKLATVPFHHTHTSATGKRSDYATYVKLPDNVPLIVHSMDSTGAWTADTDNHIKSHLNAVFPDRKKNDSHKNAYDRALHYARQCTSVVARTHGAMSLLALMERAKAGRLVPGGYLQAA
jgi:hypothetical protein